MHIRPLPAEEAAVRRYVEDLWLPYQRDLASAVDGKLLADDVDLAAEEVAFRLEKLAEEGYRAWVAVDAPEAAVESLATDGTLAGFITAEGDPAPSVFDRPDRLVVGDFYVAEPYRGTGLADRLLDRVAERAREADAGELALDVDVGNERAIAFYERCGFEPYRYRMRAPLEDLE